MLGPGKDLDLDQELDKNASWVNALFSNYVKHFVFSADIYY